MGGACAPAALNVINSAVVRRTDFACMRENAARRLMFRDQRLADPGELAETWELPFKSYDLT